MPPAEPIQRTSAPRSRSTRATAKAGKMCPPVPPAMSINAQSYEVRADGELLTCEAATVLPMAQRYFLF